MRRNRNPYGDCRMEITLNVSEELATRLQPVEQQLPQILELGIRELNARQGGTFAGLAEILEKLASLPSPEEVLALRASPAIEERIEVLLEKNQAEGLSPDEKREWEQFSYVEHLVRMAKIHATARLRRA